MKGQTIKITTDTPIKVSIIVNSPHTSTTAPEKKLKKLNL